MRLAPAKYNPCVRGDEELIRSFVVRKSELALALETLRENAAAKHSSNQHLLFVGSRGIGKTMLVRRVAAEARAVPEVAAAWYPIVFGEESYEARLRDRALAQLLDFADRDGKRLLLVVENLNRRRFPQSST